MAIWAVHATTFAALAFWSWRKWPDPLIDFGRELYMAWQISEGRVLYRDVESLFGPLSPYVNALWFAVFGDSLTTLIACNLAILAALTLGIHHVARLSSDRLTATVASLTTLGLFGFSQYRWVGNFNFVTPYAHDATHGLALSVAMIVCLHRAVATRRPRWWASAGFCCGGTLLTKPEVAVAALGAAAATLVADGLISRRAVYRRAHSIVLFGAAVLVPGLLFFLYFSSILAPGSALEAVARAWTAAIGTGVASNSYYVTSMGLDVPSVRIAGILLSFVALTGYLLLGAALSWWSHRQPGRESLFGPLLPVAMALAALFLMQWGTVATALPLVCVTGTIVASVSLYRQRDNGSGAIASLLFLTWSVFASLLLLKIGLNPRVDHYGFYLALPAMVVLVILVCWTIPQVLCRAASAQAARGFRQIAIAALSVTAAAHLAVSNQWYRAKTIAVGTGGDRFLASAGRDLWQGEATRDALNQISRLGAGRDFTLAVLPEGVMLNYLLRRQSPLRIVTAMPPEILVFGEDAVLDSLVSSPPDFVALVAKDTSEYGVKPFGTEEHYGRRTLEWVRAHYRSVVEVGRQGPDTGIEILERSVTAQESTARSRHLPVETRPRDASRSSNGPT